jgi:diguanylate cyclase (GGDEF)-like protein
MTIWAANLTDRIFAIDGTSPAQIAVIEERIAALQPRMAWLYLLMAIYFAGLAGVMPGARWTLITNVPLGLLIVFRIRYWLRYRGHEFRGEAARSALRGITLGAVTIALSYVAILGVAAWSASAIDFQLMLLSASICSLASALTIAILKRAARAVLLLLGLPASILAIALGPNPVASVVGVNLLMCTVLSLHMLKLQDQSFVRHFQLRLGAEVERGRAERAEQTALVEQSQAKAAAATDFLTGLPNRRAFLEAIGKRQSSSSDDSLLVLDLDGFKPVNDIFGHPIGDELLKLVSKRLCGLGEADTCVARLGGDEFAMIVRGLTGGAANSFAEAVIAELGRPYLIGSSAISVGACCGVATLCAGAVDSSLALRQADLALYRAKAIGRGTVQGYEHSMGDVVRRRSDIERALRKPGIEHDIELAFQPIVNLETMEIASFEALARWSHSRLGPVSPSDFIPITEQIQLIEAMSDALLIRAVGHAKAWRPTQQLSFNLSAVQLCSLGSAKRVLEIIADADFPPDRLQIEVTETAMMADLDSARTNIDALRSAGVDVALDDFGAGFASIGYLRELKFDKLKLDGSLLAACSTAHGAALLKGVIELARSIGTPCIAEHVETMQEVNLLRGFGCRFGQGYWLGRPVGADEAEALANAPFGPAAEIRLAS